MSSEKVTNANSIIFVFVISIIIGITTLIFDIDKFSYLTCLIIHYLIVNVVVVVGSFFLISVESYIKLLTSILVIYALSYLVTYLKMRVTSRELDSLIKIIQSRDKNE
jgi:cytochrome c biogenesis factor